MSDIQLPMVIRQSNEYLRGKYKLTDLQQKIVNLGIARIQADPAGRLTAEIKASELRAITGLSGSGLYSQLKDLAGAIQNQRILITDREKNRFESYVIIPSCRYRDGNFSLAFNDDLKAHLYPQLQNMRKAYTVLSLKTLLDLSLYASRLFQILKSFCSYPFKKGKRVVEVPYGVSEIKFALGIYDPEMIINIPSGTSIDKNGDVKTIYRKARISKEISDGHISWDEAVSYIEKKDRHFEDWYSFKSRILMPACREITDNPEADIICSLEAKKSGRGGKVVSVVFRVEPDPNYKGSKLLTEEKNLIISQLQDLMEDEGLSASETEKLCEAGSWDYQYIEETYNLAKNQTYIKNFVGWMTEALKNRYIDNKPVETMKGKRQEDIARLDELVEEINRPEVRKETMKRVKARRPDLFEDEAEEDEELLAVFKEMSKEKRQAILKALRDV